MASTAAPKPLTSVELRWFIKGPHAPDGMDGWIRADWTGAGRPRPPTEETRTDSYLVVRGPDVGAKKRGQQQLEIKIRGEVSPARAFGRHSGCVERWTKYAVDNVAAASLPTNVRSRVEQATQRVDVRKTRWLRRLAIRGASLNELPPDQWVNRAVGVELTRIVAREQHWWSVGFEAFPDEETVRQALAPAVTRVLEPLRTITLTAADSMAYPEWLAARVLTGSP
jgi:hypothetical protein